MTPQQKTLVRQTFARFAAHPARAGALFYDRLFALEPSLRTMFPKNLQTLGQKFVNTLGAMIGALDDAGLGAVHLDALGRRHAMYGVQPQHYEAMREALLWSLAQLLGDEFDDDAAAAWCAAYKTAARAMQKASQRAAERL